MTKMQTDPQNKTTKPKTKHTGGFVIVYTRRKLIRNNIAEKQSKNATKNWDGMKVIMLKCRK